MLIPEQIQELVGDIQEHHYSLFNHLFHERFITATHMDRHGTIVENGLVRYVLCAKCKLLANINRTECGATCGNVDSHKECGSLKCC